jgi:anaerobic selenocysteine-containing dehydrogenase
VNLEGRRQRQRRAVDPPFGDELEFLALVGERLGLPISPWPAEAPPAERAPLPARVALAATPQLAPTRAPARRGRGFELVTYRALFSGPGVERVEPLAFQRPLAEIEVSAADARSLRLASGDAVSVRSNGTSRTLRARVHRRLRKGVVRMASEHAAGLGHRVEVTKA